MVIFTLAAMLNGSGILGSLSSGDRKIDIDTGKVAIGTAELNPDITENPDISYPGYGELTFKANKKTQDIYLQNPKENTCYFKMSLILSDGRTIWRSDQLEPGNAFNHIELGEALPKGTYENAVLKYDSYSIKDGRRLNGSSINLTLRVD